MIWQIKSLDLNNTTTKAMENKTALQQMLDELMANEYTIPLELIVKCKELIEVEKQQITAFAKLWEEKLLDGRINSVDDLYNVTYKQ
jgi:hypothetical protein